MMRPTILSPAEAVVDGQGINLRCTITRRRTKQVIWAIRPGRLIFEDGSSAEIIFQGERLHQKILREHMPAIAQFLAVPLDAISEYILAGKTVIWP